jgi:sigma-E factor negative regulatory protein RseA
MERQMDTHKKIREHVSALSDGELPAPDIELAFAALQEADGEYAWGAYHRIGDVLRGQATPELSEHFNQRLAARLAAEPTHVRRAASPGASAPTKEPARPVTANAS